MSPSSQDPGDRRTVQDVADGFEALGGFVGDPAFQIAAVTLAVVFFAGVLVVSFLNRSIEHHADAGGTVVRGPIAVTIRHWRVGRGSASVASYTHVCGFVTVKNRRKRAKATFALGIWDLTGPSSQYTSFTNDELSTGGTLSDGVVAPGGVRRGTVCFPYSDGVGTYTVTWTRAPEAREKWVWTFRKG